LTKSYHGDTVYTVRYNDGDYHVTPEQVSVKK